MAVSQLFTSRPALNSAGVVTGGWQTVFVYRSFFIQKLALLFIRTISQDARQLTPRRHSILPSAKLHTL